MTGSAILETIEVPPLKFFVKLPDGQRYEVDLTEFADGGCIERVPAKAKKAWAGDFEGRPLLAREFAECIAEDQPSEKVSRQLRWGMRNFFRFLDADEANGGPTVMQLADVTTRTAAPFSVGWAPSKATVTGRPRRPSMRCASRTVVRSRSGRRENRTTPCSGSP